LPTGYKTPVPFTSNDFQNFYKGAFVSYDVIWYNGPLVASRISAIPRQPLEVCINHLDGSLQFFLRAVVVASIDSSVEPKAMLWNDYIGVIAVFPIYWVDLNLFEEVDIIAMYHKTPIQIAEFEHTRWSAVRIRPTGLPTGTVTGVSSRLLCSDEWKLVRCSYQSPHHILKKDDGDSVQTVYAEDSAFTADGTSVALPKSGDFCRVTYVEGCIINGRVVNRAVSVTSLVDGNPIT
ncbi:hypothetical protein PMAYCL1PPCAC_10518, partial [Pristionchus mayeri]